MIRIIIPAYNEEGNLQKVVEDFSAAVNGNQIKFFIIDDGSTDKTPIIVTKLAKTYPIVHICHRTNLGVAKSFKDGLVAATRNDCRDKDVVVIAEGDGTSDPKLLPEIVSRINSGSDIVIASRYIKGGSYQHFPLKRRLFSLGANFILKTVFRLRVVTDYTIFYRGYKAKILKDAIKKYGQKLIETEKFVANSELLIKLSAFSPNITEVPFVYNYNLKKGKSALKIIPNLFSYLRLFRNHQMSKGILLTHPSSANHTR